MTYATVPRIWVGETVVCLAAGPSLTQADVDACHGRARVIAVKDTIRMAPFADCLYCCGSDRGRWWDVHGPKLGHFEGLRYTLDPKAASRWGAHLLRQGPDEGLSTTPTTLCTGKNSGYQAVGLAFLLGARRILLLGFDLQPATDGREYFFGAHPYPRPVKNPYDRFIECFATLVEPLKKHGVEVINCTRDTALTAFPQMSIQEALA